MSPLAPFVLVHGASWVLPDGRVIKVPGFHMNWIASHPSIAPGTTNTAEFVAKTGWISAVLHEGGYLELITRSVLDKRQRDCVWNLLQINASILGKVVLMLLGKEGILSLEAGLTRERFDALLDATARP
ncbi:MAG: hypothetical protein NT061_10650 [Spirochaetes bacterium]|nr:hypothetical protein [Spirochaetota bacterium]